MRLAVATDWLNPHLQQPFDQARAPTHTRQQPHTRDEQHAGRRPPERLMRQLRGRELAHHQHIA
jgi:hypothetical protein